MRHVPYYLLCSGIYIRPALSETITLTLYNNKSPPSTQRVACVIICGTRDILTARRSLVNLNWTKYVSININTLCYLTIATLKDINHASTSISFLKQFFSSSLHCISANLCECKQTKRAIKRCVLNTQMAFVFLVGIDLSMYRYNASTSIFTWHQQIPLLGIVHSVQK